MSRSLFNVRAAALLALAVLLAGVAAHAEVVVLKDGFTIHGTKIVKEKDVLLDDKAGIAFLLDKPNGLTAIDDGPRWVVFPNSERQLADVRDTNRFKDFTGYTRDRVKGQEKLPSTARGLIYEKPWDLKEWTREIRYGDQAKNAFHTVRLQITVITPYYVRVGSSTHVIGRYFLLKEWDPAFIRSLLVNHPDLVEPSGKPDPAKREKLVRFWIQADMLDMGEKELAQLIGALPAEKERHGRLLSEINGLKVEKVMAEIERARDSGRHQWAIKTLEALPKTFPREDIPQGVSNKVRALTAEYEKRKTQFDLARRHLVDLVKQVNPAGNVAFLTRASNAVRDEVHMDTLGRIERFVTLADRRDNDLKVGRRPDHSPEELLSSAITGWHLGKVAAEEKVDLAYKVWTAREMALDYLRTPAAGRRQQILAGYLAGPNTLKYDELEKLISLIPPPEAPAAPPTGTQLVRLPATVESPLGVEFLLRLPDEYQPGRSYPLLVLLPDPNSDRTMQAMLDRFGDLPNRHGYIVAIAQWWDPNDLAVKYKYSKEEHALFMQLLNHVRRAYQVDSDRVFVWGNGEGGEMALDVGGSHPDLFAGVVPVNPAIIQKLYIPCEYWVNFHQLPVYMIIGDKFDTAVNTIQMMSQRWMPKGFPTLVVSYKGRSHEWFAGELDYAFDWMGRKRRADPGKLLGPKATDRTKAGFSSVRLADNRFHWLSAEIKPDRAAGDIRKAVTAPAPVKLSASIAEGNTIKATAIGAREVTIWFGRGMVDYTKPVKVQVADAKPVTEMITPDITVLMEDLYERVDRQRPYFGRMKFTVR